MQHERASAEDTRRGSATSVIVVLMTIAAAMGVVVVSLPAMTRQAASAAESVTFCKSRRTLYVTMRDTYMDCPERERAQRRAPRTGSDDLRIGEETVPKRRFGGWLPFVTGGPGRGVIK